jgi:hypothetical protein
MTPAASKGIIDKPSNHSVDETVERLKNILQANGVTRLRWSTTAERRKRWE